MSVELIYKTTSPEAIAWWRDAEAKVKIDRAAQLEYEKAATSEFGTPPHPQYVEEFRRSRRTLWFRNDRPFGLDCAGGEKPPADSGWRIDSRDGIWMPKLATKKGKERAAELSALCTFVLRDHLPEIGVAPLAFAGHALYGPGLEFDQAEGALYVVWGSGKCAAEAVASQAKVRSVEWVEVPRSVWYAREEAKAAQS